ncbi:Pentatricopeptide repeat-containing protein [Apostasia shenzhenica]|uniref:Pentatricopeptide repeat-containing protein n=1 Tax=Apostasia shenzhenica TaxID=1088818 RepID=A0A2I0A2J4_9ASPA|nr:Pentatricopeptide repeat-containing protein [Apostasia shenzhenica]
MEAAFSVPSRSFIVSALKSSIDQKLLPVGQSLHSLAIKVGFLPEILLCNHLLNMYAKCESLQNAHKLFDEMPERNLISYSTLISSHSRSENPILALPFLSQLQNQGLIANQFVFSSAIVACSKLKSVICGEQIHAQAIVSGFGSDPFVNAALVDMNSKFGHLDSAISVFRQCQVRDPVLFNSMVSGYVSFGANFEALLLFLEARRFIDFKPTEFTFGSLIKACSNLNREVGLQVHCLILKSGFNINSYVGTSLVDMYGRFGHINSFEKASEDILSYDITLYNAMIGAYSRNNLDEFALDCFIELILEGFTPNECTLSSALKSCACLKLSGLGRIIHGIVKKSELGQDLVVNTALIDMYMKCGKVEESCRIFDIMHERNTISYNSMIFGLGQNGYFDKALNLFIKMNCQYINVDPATFVALINSCRGQEWVIYGNAIKHGFCADLMIRNALLCCLMRQGSSEEALDLFSKMKERDVVSWTAVISGFTQLDLHAIAIELFKAMCSTDIYPNSFTFSSILKACGNSGNLKQGKCIHGFCIKLGVTDEFSNSALLDMYAKCGVLEDSRMLFDELNSKEIVPWNTMITAYAQHGDGRRALELYDMMEEQNIHPNHVTFVSLLSACSHSGMFEDGIRIFELMVSKHRIVPLIEHYACMVYLFGRAGFLHRAKVFIENMPVEADASIWTVFLVACKLHGDFELAQVARNKLEGLQCEDNSTMVLVSNMLSEVGKWDEAEKARKKIGEWGMMKEPGVSWVQNSEAFA